MRAPLVVALACSLLPAQAPFPNARRDYRTEASLRTLALGDLNSDGHIDIALPNAALLGTGDGSFRAPVSSPPLLTLLDANGDGHLDYIASAGTGSEPKIVIHHGRGDATFGSEFVATVPFHPHRIEAADFNGDGIPDLALIQSQQSPSRIAVLIGSVAGEPIRGLTFAFADLNGDGRTDIARIAENRELETLLGKGDGTFESPVTLGKIFTNSLLALADLNEDGNSDLIVVSGTITVLPGKGDGTFLPLSSSVPHVVVVSQSVLTDDWNGDGRTDVIVKSPSHLSVYLSDNTGRLRPGVHNDLGLYPDDDVQVGDINGDGVLDVVAANAAGSAIAVALGRADGSVRTATVLPNTILPNLTAADLDGDGLPDLAGIAKGRLQVAAGRDKGEFLYATLTGADTPMSHLALADFTGDGLPDVAGISQTGIVILANRGRFRFEQIATLPAPQGPFERSALATDLNGDGRIDLITNSARGPLSWINQGGGKFAPPVSIGSTGGTFAAGDVNGDGKIDLAISGTGGELLLLSGNGNGTFRPAMAIGTGSGVTIGDFNGDGKADIATVSLLTNFLVYVSLAVLPGNGDGTFQPPVQRRIGKMSSSREAVLASADFNADGVDDVVWGCYNQLALFLGQRGTQPAEPIFLGAGRDLGSLAIADFDKDGRPDIATGPPDSAAVTGTVAILFNKP
ncbi:MAG: VCBS repeat-containing protein [Bryobacterales bacterium]|nr:VCBS repeat-containing protein [Bryobacterales bacterium]